MIEVDPVAGPLERPPCRESQHPIGAANGVQHHQWAIPAVGPVLDPFGQGMDIGQGLSGLFVRHRELEAGAFVETVRKPLAQDLCPGRPRNQQAGHYDQHAPDAVSHPALACPAPAPRRGKGGCRH